MARNLDEGSKPKKKLRLVRKSTHMSHLVKRKTRRSRFNLLSLGPYNPHTRSPQLKILL